MKAKKQPPKNKPHGAEPVEQTAIYIIVPEEGCSFLTPEQLRSLVELHISSTIRMHPKLYNHIRRWSRTDSLHVPAHPLFTEKKERVEAIFERVPIILDDTIPEMTGRIKALDKKFGGACTVDFLFADGKGDPTAWSYSRDLTDDDIAILDLEIRHLLKKRNYTSPDDPTIKAHKPTKVVGTLEEILTRAWLHGGIKPAWLEQREQEQCKKDEHHLEKERLADNLRIKRGIDADREYWRKLQEGLPGVKKTNKVLEQVGLKSRRRAGGSRKTPGKSKSTGAKRG